MNNNFSKKEGRGKGRFCIALLGLLLALGTGSCWSSLYNDTYDATHGTPDTVITTAAIPGVTQPTYGETPVTTITETAQYTGTVSWSPSDATFAAGTVYTATITLTAKAGYTLTGVAENFFTVAGATATNSADSGVVTAVFPATFPAGQKITVTADSVTFNMAYVPGGLSFMSGLNDDGDTNVSNAYWIGETEVTWELWNKVYTWATDNSIDHDRNGTAGDDTYTFANAGTQGDGTGDTDQHPVTTINWRDSIVWCNALTEWYNANNGTESDLDLVYYTDSDYQTPLRTATDTDSVNTVGGSEDKPYIKASSNDNFDMANCTAKGFRLPTLAEWSCAARYKGSDNTNGAYQYPADSGYWWTPGDYASGDIADYSTSTTIGDYAVYDASSTAEVKSLGVNSDNALGLFDMSGNVWEWNFDWHPDHSGSYRVLRGGGWSFSAYGVQVGYWNFIYPYYVNFDVGFRFSRTQ